MLNWKGQPTSLWTGNACLCWYHQWPIAPLEWRCLRVTMGMRAFVTGHQAIASCTWEAQASSGQTVVPWDHTKDCALNCKSQPCSKRYDVLLHANNPPVSNFIGEHQQDRWPVNQSLASLSKRRQFRSAGKPPQTNSLPLPPPLAKERMKKIPARGCLSPTWLCIKMTKATKNAVYTCKLNR